MSPCTRAASAPSASRSATRLSASPRSSTASQRLHPSTPATRTPPQRSLLLASLASPRAIFLSCAFFSHKHAATGDKIDTATATLKSLKETVNGHLDSLSAVTKVTQASFKKLVKEAPRDMGKALLFTSKKETMPTWAALSLAMKGRLFVGEVHKSEKKLAKRYEVTEFPTILVFPPLEPGQKFDSVEPRVYTGLLKAQPIKAFMQLYARDADAAAAADALAIPELADDSCLAAHCADLGGLCAVYIAPDQPRRQTAYDLDVLASVQDLRGDDFVKFSWISGRAHADFIETAFGLQPQEYPQLAVLQPRKLVAAPFIGSFRLEDVSRWLTDLQQGRAATSAIPGGKLPSLGDAGSCNALVEKRKRKAVRAAARTASSSSSASSSSTSSSTMPGASAVQEAVQGALKWKRPARPLSKRGDVVSVTDATAGDVVTHRARPFVARFQRPDGATGEAAERKEFEDAGKSVNSMVAFVTVACEGEDTAALRKAWLPAGAACGGQIVAFPAAATLTLPAIAPTVGTDPTPEEAAAATVEALAARHAALAEARARATSTYTGAVTLKSVAAWALTLLDGVKVDTLGNDANAFQTWIMTNMLSPRVLVATDKAEAPALARALAAEFHEYAEVGVVGPSSPAVLQQFQITTMPAVRIVRPALKPSPDGKTHQLAFDLVPVNPQALYFNSVAGALDGIAGQYHPRSAAPAVNVEGQGRPGKDEL